MLAQQFCHIVHRINEIHACDGYNRWSSTGDVARHLNHDVITDQPLREEKPLPTIRGTQYGASVPSSREPGHSRDTPFTDVGEATPSVGHLGAMTAFRNCADDGRPCRLLSLRGVGRLGAQSTTEACRAGTCHTLGVLVNESMDDPVRLVKA